MRLFTELSPVRRRKSVTFGPSNWCIRSARRSRDKERHPSCRRTWSEAFQSVASIGQRVQPPGLQEHDRSASGTMDLPQLTSRSHRRAQKRLRCTISPGFLESCIRTLHWSATRGHAIHLSPISMRVREGARFAWYDNDRRLLRHLDAAVGVSSWSGR